MKEFFKTINGAEQRYTYLNLTDDNGETFGHLFKNNLLTVITDDNKNYNASINTLGNQIIVRRWYMEEKVYVGDKIKIVIDETAVDVNDRTPIKISIIERSEITEKDIENLPSQIQDEIDIRNAEINMQMENDLEDFLANNLNLIDSELKLYNDLNGRTGRQYTTDIGIIDLLCKKGNDYIVIELKKGRTSDHVVGQISRYIGWVKQNIANSNTVKGIIIVHDYDPKLKYAVLANDNIDLKYYEIKIAFISEEQALSKK